jgi:translation initiation factor IF-1
LPKEDLIEFEGTVMELLPDARFRVRLDNGHETLAYSSGKMKKNRIRILAGDRAAAAVSPPVTCAAQSCSRDMAEISEKP